MTKGRTPLLACGPFLMLALLGSCGDRSTPSAEQNRQLDNAAEMLDSAPDILSNVDSDLPGETEGNNVQATDGSAR